MAKSKFNLEDAMDKSLEGAKVDTKNKVLTIERKVDKFITADRLMNASQTEVQPITKQMKPKLETKVINLTIDDSKRLDDLLDRCMLLKLRVNKSELLRMGLVSLGEACDETLIKCFSSIEQLKAGKIK